MPRAPHPLLSRWRRLAARAVELDAAPAGTPEARFVEVLVGAWGAARLLVIAPLSPLVAAAMAVEALRATAWTARLIERFPATIDTLLRGGSGEQPDLPGRALRVARRPAGRRYVITSDLHRCIEGRLDWPRAQHSDGLLAAALAHYADEGWTLVENGDVEDLWLTGGSAYGVAYDVGRMVANLLPRAARDEVLPHLYGDHLDRIVDNNRDVYRLIVDGFGPERYVRLVGNHDDALLDERVVDRLRRHLPEVEVCDVLVLDGDAGPAGAVLHGHQTDAWNLPGRDFLGKFCTWLATALVDAPLVRATPGMPDVEESATLLGGRLHDRLTSVGRRIGVTLDFYSLDEVRLLDSWRRWFGGGPGPGTTAGPVLVLGHTHLPLVDPLVPDVDPSAPRASWANYLNSGCGVLWEAVTCVEWDGTDDPDDPVLRLVLWRFAADDELRDRPGVAVCDGRPVIRDELVRPHGSSTLQVLHEVLS